MSTTAENLKRAYQLIRNDQTADAQNILRPILDSEPDNAHAWWLLAYAADDPNEVRYALTRVLDLDPNYPNAPKAREMLERLDSEFPTGQEAPAPFDTTFGAATEPFSAESFFDDTMAAESTDSFGEDAFGDIFSAPEDELLTADELFADLDEEPAAKSERKRAAAGESKAVSGLQALLEPEEPLDDEARAALEEKAARRGRGRGARRLLLILLVLILVPVAVVAILLSGGEEASDPGPLKTVALEADAVRDAKLAADSVLRFENLGSSSQIVVADSALGSTMFVEICAVPGPDLTRVIMRGMEIVAQQAAQLEGQLPAVGVSVDVCNGDTRDTLYRAYATVGDAARYANGDLGADEVGEAKFQSLWKTP